jgi:hypothetical protein
MSPEEARAWIRVIRDAILVLAGTAMFATVLILYIVRREPPSLELIGAAGACLGLGVLLRSGELVIRDNGKTNGGKNGA